VLKSPLNFSDDHLDRDRVVAAARDYDISVALARLYEFAMHRLHGGQVLLDDLIERSPAIVRVALDSPYEPDVCVRIDEYLDVAEIPHPGVDEQQNPVDDDHIRRLDVRRLGPAQMRDEIVLGLVDRLALAEGFEMKAEQIVVERIRVIPIELPALVQSQ